jgi:hypothetical protein
MTRRRTQIMQDFRNAQDVEQRVNRATSTAGATTHQATVSTAHTGWTPAELRGIPAVGYRCGSGAISETEPGWNLDDWPGTTTA